MSPEQCDPDRYGEPGFASDVWGLGATLFEAVAGYRAFDDGDRSADDLAGQFPQLVDEPYELPARVPAEVVKVLSAALDPEPGQPPAAARDRRGPRAGPRPPARRTTRRVQGDRLSHRLKR